MPQFFTVDEVPEAQLSAVSGWDLHGAVFTPKLDGSLVSPVPLDGRVRWLTRLVACRSAEEFVARISASGSGPRYNDFAEECFHRQLTPLFEWCEAGHCVGVIVHEEDALVLTAVRHNITGAYEPQGAIEQLAAGFSVPCVSEIDWRAELRAALDAALTGESLAAFVASVAKWEGREGCVLRCADGRLLKIKAEWYLQLPTIVRTASAAARVQVRLPVPMTKRSH